MWAPKPVKTPAYKAGLKPWVKLADLKAKHKGQTDWHEVVVDDGRLIGEYVRRRPARKCRGAFIPTRANGSRCVEGEVRVEIEGQEPFTATRGSLVNIPRQTIYSRRDDRHGAEPAIHAERVRREDGLPEGR